MRDIKEKLFPHETVHYQYTYPLWMKIVGGLGLVVVGYILYDDFVNGRTFFVLAEVLMLGYLAYWLWLMQRDSGQYVLTNMRVMRLGGQPSEDLVIEYPHISEVRILKDAISGTRSVQVKTLDQRVIRMPLHGMGQAKSIEMVQLIDQFRGLEVNTPAQAGADTPENQ